MNTAQIDPRIEERMRRYVADSRDRPTWKAARVGRIGGSDAGKFAKLESVPSYIAAKLATNWEGNTYTEHGHDREADMLLAVGAKQNHAMFHAVGREDHVATPDSILLPAGTTEVRLAQAKSSTKPMPAKCPPVYLRQIWWEQYVLGADRTLLVWEQHRNFRPLAMEPETMWIERDDEQIGRLITIADAVLAGLRQHTALEIEMSTPRV